MKLTAQTHFTRYTSKILISLFALFLIFGLSACSTIENASAYYQAGTYPIDSDLVNFYNDLDGNNWLGSAISPLFDQNGLRCQYTVTAMLCFDPDATGITRFRLAPLGLLIDVKEAPAQEIAQDSVTVDGYSIDTHFLQMYKKFNGMLYAGKPLTNAFYNPVRNRIEQYFENLGFYYKLDGSENAIGLIEYGQEICRDICPRQWGNAIVDLNINRKDPLTDFVFAVEFLGGTNRFGARLTDLFIASDGYLEMIHENAVFYAPLDHPREVRLRPLTTLMSMPVAPPGGQLYGEEEQMTFYPIDGDLGYHVPVVFQAFINQNGGNSLFGAPLSDPYNSKTGLPRQCFEYLCLEYDKTASPEDSVFLVNIGQLYLKSQPEMTPFSIKGAIGSALEKKPEIDFKRLSFVCSERSPQVGKQETQTITILVFDRETHQPVPQVDATLLVTKPNGEQLYYEFPPTSAKGLASVEVDAMTDSSDSSLITYKACIQSNDSPATCISDAYMIWGEH